MEPITKFDMAGTWMDLTGNDGLDGVCEDGTAVLNAEKGTLEYSVKMSFPFYWKQNIENLSSCSSLCQKLDIGEINIEMDDQSRVIE